MSAVAVNRESKGTDGRSLAVQCHLCPAPEHKRRICPDQCLHGGSDSVGAVHCRLLLLPRGVENTSPRLRVAHATARSGLWRTGLSQSPADPDGIPDVPKKGGVPSRSLAVALFFKSSP